MAVVRRLYGMLGSKRRAMLVFKIRATIHLHHLRGDFLPILKHKFAVDVRH